MTSIKRYIILAAVFLGLSLTMPSSLSAQELDPSGANTGTIKDVPAATAGQPTLEEVANTV
ncbi:MAG: ammonium transporter, partial [Ignavibacteria bacterium]|nr:ammonium transporter [Ignavibacteria bacterium]